MCYSKEVSLLTSVLVFAGSYWSWVRLKTKDLIATFKKQPVQVKDFVKYSLIGFSCAGGHQFFLFLSLQFANQFYLSQVFYKLALTSSFLILYFLVLALEKLVKVRIGSPIYLVVIIGVFLEMLLRTMLFENNYFYVRSYDNYLWMVLWMLGFCYWNVWIFDIANQSKSKSNRKMLLLYPWVIANITYFLSLFYNLLAFLFYANPEIKNLTATIGISPLFQNLDGMRDTASIWCAFTAITILWLPFYFSHFIKKFKASEITKIPQIGVYKLFYYFFLSLILCAGLVYFAPITLDTVAHLLNG